MNRNTLLIAAQPLIKMTKDALIFLRQYLNHSNFIREVGSRSCSIEPPVTIVNTGIKLDSHLRLKLQSPRSGKVKLFRLTNHQYI